MKVTLNLRALRRIASGPRGDAATPAWLTELLATAEVLGDLAVVDRERWAAIAPKAGLRIRPNGGASPSRLQALPQERWPVWAKAVALLARDPDRGVGDTVERWATRIGGAQFKAMSLAVGLPCRCAERQAEWNAHYPYLVAPPRGSSNG